MRFKRWLRYGWPSFLLADYRWYRRWAGGHWEQWWIDSPVNSAVWMPREVCGERPGLGRGRPTCEQHGPDEDVARYLLEKMP